MLALKSNNTLWAWGRNHRGQLGNNSINFVSSPTQINVGAQYSNVVADCNIGGSNSNYGFSMAIKTDGNLQTWGDNERGQLGIGSRFNFKQTPQDVACPVALSNSDFVETQIAIYPNPSKDIFTIETQNQNQYEYQITDINGRKIKVSSTENQIDISNQAKGIYILKIIDTTQNTFFTKKLIKQ